MERLRQFIRLVLGTLLVYVLLRPAVGLGHELTVAGLAWLVHGLISTGFWEPIIGHIGLDPIYAGAAIRAMGGVEVTGFAVAGPLGVALHSAVPGVFVACDRVTHGAAISMVAAPGAPALGRGLAAFGADLVWLTASLWMVWHWRRASRRLALLGLLIQAQIAVHHLLHAQLTVADVDASGLPLALQLALPNGGWFTDALDGLPGQVRQLAIGAGLVCLGYASAGALLGSGLAVSRLAHAWRTARSGASVSSSRPIYRWRVALASVALAAVTAWSPIGALALGESNWQATSAALASVQPPVRRALAGHARAVVGPTAVRVTQAADGGWQYTVDGSPETIRGVGYNPQYATLSAADRAAVYQRDFGDMHQLGINTIEGWFEGQFDSVTLDAAARNGIGVLMPFELNQDWPFENANVQQSILDHVSAYVERYKSHPAVRMWALGNENLHRVLYARWVSQENVPQARARADAFAAFLPVLVDRIHQIDPLHPVVYRDAEDVYLGRIRDAFARDGVDRPWLVYGANVYSMPRLQQIVGAWPSQWPGHALMISEFAPGGVGPLERPLGFQQQWMVIRSRPGLVLGGMAYTWATNGPEDLDRVFGLVDPGGVPTDGALAALSAEYLSETTTAEASTGPG